MDPFYLAIVRFRQRNFDECISLCSELLRKNPLDQAVWSLKTRALTEQVRVDFLEIFDDGIAESIFTEDTIATAARPGTSLRIPTARLASSRDGPSPAIRPVTQSGRPVSGVTRPGTSSSGRPGTSLDQALKSRATTARPISATTGRHVRVGTASMLSSGDGPFINLSRLNIHKYAAQESIAKPLFEYLFYVENDAKQSLELAKLAQKAGGDQDWWWQMQLALTWLRLGQPRNAEKHFRFAIQLEPMLLAYIGLAKVYVKLDQPLAALEACEKGLEKFPNDVTILTEIARLQEGLQNMTLSVKYYRDILSQDSSNIEAIACIGMHHFYTDQPEVSLRFYRRLLQMGLYTAELFVNLGLCCFYSQQYDMTLICFQRALNIAGNDCVAEVWYNLGHIAMGMSDTTWGSQCFRLAISCDNNHAEAYNNLGVLEARKGRNEQAVAFFQTAASLAPHLFEPLHNQAKIADSVGDLQNSYLIVQKALDNYPDHADSKLLFNKLRKHFESLPGARCMYTTATRASGIVAADNIPWVGPGSYDPKYPAIVARKETLAPFDTTELRAAYRPSGFPSPCHYNPWQRPRYEIGCPLMRGRGMRFPPSSDFTCSPGPVHKLKDPWLQMIIDLWVSRCMKPRVKFEKYVSNNVPTICHPLELRSFVCGVDGRMYPWRMNRKFRIPGPCYDTYKILTSQSFTPRIVNFGAMSKRPPLFPKHIGFGPADFSIPRSLSKNGGIFLSLSAKDPHSSSLRLFDTIVNHIAKAIYPTPFHYSVIREFERMCPKAVSAPFKSTAPRLQPPSKFATPAPNEYFDSRKTMKDLIPQLIATSSPPEPAPFLSTNERFHVNYNEYFLPAPCDYYIRGMADDIECICKRNIPAVINPRLGFLISSIRFDYRDLNRDNTAYAYHVCQRNPGKWRNWKPKKVVNYPYKGAPAKLPDSPGPIYDTRTASAVIKGKRSLWDPRSPKCKTGFLNSGPSRQLVLQLKEPSMPGPGLYYTGLPLDKGGRIATTEKRFRRNLTAESPAPTYKFHEKVGSSVWRGTHLGTFNRCLKGIYRQTPNSGGYHPYGPIDDVCDTLFDIHRGDLCTGCPKTNIDRQKL